MRAGTLLLALALLAVPLTGCLGGDEGSGGEPAQKQRADVSQDAGGIEGVVTDSAVQPVDGADVTLVSTVETVGTASDGSYAFSEVQPGIHTVRFDAEGFLSTQKEVQVEAGEVSSLDVVLTHEASDAAFTQTLELVGFIECGVGWETSPNPVPGLTSNAAAICSVPNILAENATNDRFAHDFRLEAPIETLVYEMDWASDSTALSTQIEVDGFPFEDEAELYRTGSTPPIFQRIDRDRFETLATNFTDNCNGENGSEADDTWCGYNFFDKGWPLQTRVFADGSCNTLPARACPVLQEEFRHVVSAFYNQPAPDGYAILDENPPG